MNMLLNISLVTKPYVGNILYAYLNIRPENSTKK